MGSVCSKKTQPDNTISIEEAIRHIKKTPFNHYLDTKTIEGFSRCFVQVTRAASGNRIELSSDRLYIVAVGEVDFSTAISNQAKVEATGYLCSKREGDLINLTHIKADATRKASNSYKINDLVEEIIVTTNGKEECLLLCADMAKLESFVAFHPELPSTIASLSTTSIEDKLRQIPFLQSLPGSKISLLAALCRYEAFDSRQVIFEQDDQADKLYLVLGGVAQVIAIEAPASRGLHAVTSKREMYYSEASVALQRSLECSSNRRTFLQSSEIVIADLQPGDYFGETALCLDLDRTCKVITLEKSLMLTVHKTDFRNFLNICPIEVRRCTSHASIKCFHAF